MRTTDKLVFRLTIEEPGLRARTIIVCPRYDGLKSTWSKPSGQMYTSQEISGNITFLGVDFLTLEACVLRTLFTLIIYDGLREVGRTEFRKTDCKWDIDHQTVEVDISVRDQYSKIDNKKDEEYNLVRLGLSRKTLKLWNYPNLQLYAVGDTTITTFSRTDFYQSQVDSVDTIEYGSDGLSYPLYMAESTNGFARVPSSHTDVAGDYQLTTYLSNLIRFTRTQDACQIVISPTSAYDPDSTWTAKIYDADGVEYATSLNHELSDFFYHQNILFVNQTSMFYVPMIIWRIGTRLITNVTLESSTTEYQGPLASEDIYPGSKKYGKEVKFNSTEISTNVSATDTGYGRVPNQDYYYDVPDTDNKWLPLYQESWFDGVSLWVKMRNMTQEQITTYRKSYTVLDFYSLGDAIQAVLGKIDNSIVFDPTTDSHFLFDTNNPVSGQPQSELYISQKSNILNLGYDYPAWLAPIKWSQIETLLKNAFDCYWDLYDDNGTTHLRIEHRLFYERGLSYASPEASAPDIDLTQTYRNGTPYTYADKSRHWEWDTDGAGNVSSASRYEYGWMDHQSEIFDGDAVEITEGYRLFTEEKTETRKVDWFSSDIDFLTSVPAECSSDGFAIVMKSLTDPDWIIEGYQDYSGQNYPLSFTYLIRQYLLFGLYPGMVQIGDDDTLVATNSSARMRVSEIEFRATDNIVVTPMMTIKTMVGVAAIDSLEYDMHNGVYKAKVRYENE